MKNRKISNNNGNKAARVALNLLNAFIIFVGCIAIYAFFIEDHTEKSRLAGVFFLGVFFLSILLVSFLNRE